jgi:histone H3/H4
MMENKKGNIEVLDLPCTSIERLIKKAGASRASHSAAKALAEILEQEARTIAIEATKLASHAGRQTIQENDVRLAVRMVKVYGPK